MKSGGLGHGRRMTPAARTRVIDPFIPKEAHARMHKLESLTARFIDDLIRLIRHATIEELLSLVDPSERPLRTHLTMRPVPRAKRVTSPPPSRVRRVRAARTPSDGVPITSHRPPTLEEITDPEKLLAITMAPVPTVQAARRVPRILATEPDAPPPVVAEPEIPRVLVRLRGNETVARASNSGIVLRRKKS
jgi:hypothetical protein